MYAFQARYRRVNDTRLRRYGIVVLDGVWGLTFRTNVNDLPGKPDIVFDDARTTLFVDGDFWHGYRFPQWEHRLTEFWRVKIAKNRERDRKTHARLRRAGWRVVRIWQHQIEKDLEGRLRNLDSLLARGPIEAA